MNISSVKIRRLKTLIILPFLLLLVASLSSCATLKKSDCLEGDWATIGYKDGSAGRRGVVQLEGHKRACGRYKVMPNKTVYGAGYKQGLAQFCTKSSGYNYGVNGKEYFGVCPTPTQKSFVSAYVVGLDVAIQDLALEVRDLRHKQFRLEMRHSSVRRNIARGKHQGHGKDKGRDKDRGPDRNKRLHNLEDRIDSIDSAINARRSKIHTMQRWYNAWVATLK